MGFSDQFERDLVAGQRRAQARLSAEQRREHANNHRQWQNHVAQDHFAVLVEANSHDHAFGASAHGQSWQDAVESFFGEGNSVRDAVSVVSVHDCRWPAQANEGNRVDR